eukprot:TRINITY_DN61857_c0_g1_i1.p2 TRINITY_DN61857_c0_g1~~TRINITY_DN61857_c0_g1_i1.p2  ORF type:complete len:328 (+),score=49.66 TRINITY_DN61857_c0_g1_i1:46-984(+)
MEKAIQAIKDFIDGEDNSEYFCFQEGHEDPTAKDDVLFLSVNGQYNFTLAFPDMLVSTEEDALTEWASRTAEFADSNKDPVAILKYATKQYSSLGIGDMEDDEDDGADDDELFDTEPVDQPRKTNEEYEEDHKFEKLVESYDSKGLTSNKQACSRLFSDLRAMWKAGKDYGFWAEPEKDNLFKWNVQFFDFEKDVPLYKDMQDYKKRTGREHIEFSMEFPSDYPFSPPFIRAIRPRFQFHTGHVTIGGSVCMELLTKTGWTAVNSIESVLIQIRTEITLGGGRIDFSNTSDYTEAEARAAFVRVANDHKWKV